MSDIPAIDLLFGSDQERLGLEAERSVSELAGAWESEEQMFRERRREVTMY